MTKRVCLVTCTALPGLDPDDRLVLGPLRALGVEPIAAAWDDPAVDWTAFDLVVLRNPWDYTSRRDEFVAWAHRVPRLVNPADVVAWNTDKRYLAGLAAAGVPVVPTAWVAPNEARDLPTAGRYVLKPAVGAGSVDAAAFAMDDAQQARLAAEHAHRLQAAGLTVMVQPYIDAIDERGETGLIFLGGSFSHAIYKGPMLVTEQQLVAGGLYRDEKIRARSPSRAQLDLAERALAAVPSVRDPLAYARVDLVPDQDGSPLVMELELTEPSLFMKTAAGAPERFAEVIAERA